MFFEIVGYILVVVLAAIGAYYASLDIEESKLTNSFDKMTCMIVLFAFLVLSIFFSGCSFGGRSERKAKAAVVLVEQGKEIKFQEVKGKLEAWTVVLNKKNKELSAATNDVARLVLQLEKAKGYMESNMVPRYVVAPIAGEVGKFRYSNIFPQESVMSLIDWLDKKEVKSKPSVPSVPSDTPVEPNTTNTTNKVKD